MVSAGQKLLSIYDNSLLYVDYQVSEQDLPAFSINMPIDVNIGSITKTFQGRVIYISPAIDAASLTYTIRAAIDNPDNALRSGMFAKALLKSTLRPQTLLVPKKAVVLKNNKNYIFVVNEDNAVIQREVTVGATGDDETEVITGVAEGDQVVTTNLSRLRDGLKVQILPKDKDDFSGSDEQ